MYHPSGNAKIQQQLPLLDAGNSNYTQHLLSYPKERVSASIATHKCKSMLSLSLSLSLTHTQVQSMRESRQAASEDKDQYESIQTLLRSQVPECFTKT